MKLQTFLVSILFLVLGMAVAVQGQPATSENTRLWLRVSFGVSSIRGTSGVEADILGTIVMPQRWTISMGIGSVGKILGFGGGGYHLLIGRFFPLGKGIAFIAEGGPAYFEFEDSGSGSSSGYSKRYSAFGLSAQGRFIAHLSIVGVEGSIWANLNDTASFIALTVAIAAGKMK